MGNALLPLLPSSTPRSAETSEEDWEKWLKFISFEVPSDVIPEAATEHYDAPIITTLSDFASRVYSAQVRLGIRNWRSWPAIDSEWPSTMWD